MGLPLAIQLGGTAIGEINGYRDAAPADQFVQLWAGHHRSEHPQDRSGPRGENMAPEPNSLAFGFAGIVALAVIVLAATTWALHHKTASAVPIPTDAIYQAQHLNLF
jgi:hypothetical protein